MTKYDTDVLVVGAGPAGVAAAVMAASLGLRTIVVEADSVGAKLHAIGALENVPGCWSTGPQLADALTSDLARLRAEGRSSLVKASAVQVASHNDRVELALCDGGILVGRTAVIATGVTSLAPADVTWVSAPAGFPASPLWHAVPEALTGQTYVLGADRPLGTWLRAHPGASARLRVLCPPTDDYKVAEVVDDSRVVVVPVSQIVLSRSMAGWTVEITGRDGTRRVDTATTVLSNLGNKPAVLSGLVQSEDGYCPTERQARQVRVAGDLRSARYQRITTAQGSGAEAVLASYYASALQEA